MHVGLISRIKDTLKKENNLKILYNLQLSPFHAYYVHIKEVTIIFFYFFIKEKNKL
jgi:hypothetical protein